MKFSELTCCPFCGNDEYYEKGYIKGRYCYYYRYDGEEADNSTMYDGTATYSNGRMYCSGCKRYLGNQSTDTLGKVAVRKLQASK